MPHLITAQAVYSIIYRINNSPEEIQIKNTSPDKTRLNAAEKLAASQQVCAGHLSHNVNQVCHVPVALPVCCDTTERGRGSQKIRLKELQAADITIRHPQRPLQSVHF